MFPLFFLLSAAVVNAVSLQILNEDFKVPVDPNTSVILFDLDHTLYRRGHTNGNYASSIIDYIQEYKGLSKREAQEIFWKFRKDYDAVVVKGLVRELGIDPKHFENYIDSRSNLKDILRPDVDQIRLFKSIRIPKLVFTNAGMYIIQNYESISNFCSNHTMNVLRLLNLQDVFDGILFVDYAIDNFAAKPDRQSYLEAMSLIGQLRPNKIFFVDDTISYVMGATKMGWHAIHYDEYGQRHTDNAVIPKISCLEDLRDHLPMIFSH
jgi:pyrimidine and pyridine-specific 5'-nucleotidase